MRIARFSFVIAILVAGSAQAEHPLQQAHQRYMACIERAVQAAAQEPYPVYMLTPAISAQCQVEEEALKAQLPTLVVEDLRAMLLPWNRWAIERIRREQREGIMLIAPR